MAESQRECRVVNFAQRTTNIPGPDGVGTSANEAAICPATSTAIIDIPDSPQQDLEKDKEEEEVVVDEDGTTYMPKRVLLAATTVLLILATVAAGVGFVATLHRVGYTIKAKTVEVGFNGFVRIAGGTQTCFKDWRIDCIYSGDILGSVQLRFIKNNSPYPGSWIKAEPSKAINLKVRAVPTNSGRYSCEMRFFPYPTNRIHRKADTINADFSKCKRTTTTTTTTTTTPRTTTTLRTTSSTTTTSTLTEEEDDTAEDDITFEFLFGFLFGMFSLVVLLSVAMYYWRKNKKKNTVTSERAGAPSFLDPTSTRHARSGTSNRHAPSSRHARSGTSTRHVRSGTSSRHVRSGTSSRHARSGTSTRHARSGTSTSHASSGTSTRNARSQSSTRNARSLTSSRSYDPTQSSRSHLSTTSYTSGTRMSTSQMSANR